MSLCKGPGLWVSTVKSSTTTPLCIPVCYIFVLGSWIVHSIQENNLLLIHVNHRIIECLRSEGTSGGHLIQPPCSSRVTYRRLPHTYSRSIAQSKDTYKPSSTISHATVLHKSKSETSLCCCVTPLLLLVAMLELGLDFLKANSENQVQPCCRPLPWLTHVVCITIFQRKCSTSSVFWNRILQTYRNFI